MRKAILLSAIALSVCIVISGSTTAEATPVEKVKVVQQGKVLDPISFRNFDMSMPVAIQHDYQATYTYPAPTGVVVRFYAPKRMVEARCNSPTYRRF